MKRLRRWTFNFAAGVSLVLLAVTLMWWTLRYSRYEGLRFYLGNVVVTTSTFEGAAYIAWSDEVLDGPLGPTTRPLLSNPKTWYFSTPHARQGNVTLPASEHHRFGFGYGDLVRSEHVKQLSATLSLAAQGLQPNQRALAPRLQARLRGLMARYSSARQIQFPLWFLAILFSVLPAWWALSQYYLRKSIAEGCCTKCGYDLRATPDRCPECGAVPEAAKGAAT